MRAKQNAAPKKKHVRSFLLTLGLILFVGYFVMTIIGLQFSVRESKAELAEKNAELAEIQAQNERLQSVVDNEDKSDYIEQVAREKLGYGMPGEKVFYDITPGA